MRKYDWKTITADQRDALVLRAMSYPPKLIEVKLQAAQRRKNAAKKGKKGKR
jgi:hypothetical protein